MRSNTSLYLVVNISSIALVLHWYCIAILVLKKASIVHPCFTVPMCGTNGCGAAGICKVTFKHSPTSQQFWNSRTFQNNLHLRNAEGKGVPKTLHLISFNFFF